MFYSEEGAGRVGARSKQGTQVPDPSESLEAKEFAGMIILA